MSMYQITGSPANPWVTPIEPQPENELQWLEFLAGRSLRITPKPYQPGDVLEFFPKCHNDGRDRRARYLSVEFDADAERPICAICTTFVLRIPLAPTRRTVTRVTAEQRGEQFVWVVETEEA